MKQELIEFYLFGVKLQEPMALITNWLMSLFCFYAFFKLRKSDQIEIYWWKRFFFVFAISTFFGGTGHLFFHYFGIPGKFPNWVVSIVAGYCAGKAMLVLVTNVNTQKKGELFLIIKGLTLLILAISLHKFIFIAVDAIITYILYCGILGYQLFKKGLTEMKYMTYGVLFSLPSVFIFLFKLNPHRWLNKDDLSHLLMLGCLVFFYIGAKKRKEKNIN